MKRVADEIIYGIIVTLVVTACTLVAVAITLTDQTIENIKNVLKPMKKNGDRYGAAQRFLVVLITF